MTFPDSGVPMPGQQQISPSADRDPAALVGHVQYALRFAGSFGFERCYEFRYTMMVHLHALFMLSYA